MSEELWNSSLCDSGDNESAFLNCTDFASNGGSSTLVRVLSWWQIALWSFVFGFLIVVAVVGNLIVMWIVFAHKRMWTVTNYFLVNLSVADLLMAVLNCAFNFTYMLQNDWPFGEFYCGISNFVANVSVAASVFTLTATSYDRYCAIVHPLRPRMSRCTAVAVIGLIWTLSCCLALPCLLYSATYPYSLEKGDVRAACIMSWPDGISHESLSDYVYNIVFLAMTYAIPMVGMGVCYTVIGSVLWGSVSIGELTDRHIETLKSKRKVVRMFIVVVSLFAFCWLPYHLYFIWVYHDYRIATYRYIQHIYLGFYWLAMSNSMINPLIYYFLNARFRNYFRVVFCCFRKFTRKATRSEPRTAVSIPLRTKYVNYQN